ncbi:hypothetical protein Tco_0627785 [Tanacetum coccineum]|uniref:Uncharacterized protein n=1 Tax=Tanacetum coccineum TaxID=301880 RepID=A0ABQ4WNL9_9ASTR
MELNGKVLVLQVQHQASDQSKIPPVESVEDTASPREILQENLKRLGSRDQLRTASPPLPLSSPLPLSPPIILPHTRASMVLMSAAAPSTYILTPRSRTPPSGTPPILPIPLPTSSLPLPLPSTNRRVDVPEVVLPPWKRLCIALGPRYEFGECSSSAAARSTGGFRANYSFVGTLDAEIRRDPDREVDYEITDLPVRVSSAHCASCRTTNVYHVGFGMLRVRTSSRAM